MICVARCGLLTSVNAMMMVRDAVFESYLHELEGDVCTRKRRVILATRGSEFMFLVVTYGLESIIRRRRQTDCRRVREGPRIH